MNIYPTITLSSSNHEIADCTLFPALVGLYADITMKDGACLAYAKVHSYKDGVFVLIVGDEDEEQSYTVTAPVMSIHNITYI